MTVFEIILVSVCALAFGLMATATVLELRRDLMMLQQNSYRHERYMRWLRQSGDTTSFAHLICYALLLCALAMTAPLGKLLVAAGMGIFAISRARALAVAKYKKPLVMTGRARRIFAVDLVLALVIIIAVELVWGLGDKIGWAYVGAMAATACLALAHFITLAALWLLRPVDAHINRKFYNAAAAKLASMPDLKIVGITGSYGKTSTKHYLHRILSEHFDTLMTPGSFNTTLGVVRTVNEHLKPYNEVFIVEMGAKQRGDIREICELVHPTAGIITAVGPQHLESFGGIDAVRDTKFELADAIPADGFVVVNNDFEQCRLRQVTNTHCVRYGVSDPAGCQYTASDIVYTPQGTQFTVNGPDGFSLPLQTALVGECNISNLVAAVATAHILGVPADRIAYGVSRIEQVEHRLSLRRLPMGVTIIDDAFNSNPMGSRMALDVLAMMTTGTRWVITPGMIELGDEQFALNRAFGAHMAACADRALIVGEYNRDAILEGLRQAGMPSDNVLCFDTFLDANAYAMDRVKAGDTILIENDLPDTFK